MTNTTLLVIVVAIVVAAAVVWVYVTRRRASLRSRFGPEYERALQEARSSLKAESALEARTRRMSKYNIRPLSRDESIHFSEAWQRVQSRFVDDPAAAVGEADTLVTDLMTTRGYPMSEFERRAEDLSVDYGGVVHHYRQAHAIAVQHRSQGASTENLRQALVHYRALFDDLLEVREPERRRA